MLGRVYCKHSHDDLDHEQGYTQHVLQGWYTGCKPPIFIQIKTHAFSVCSGFAAMPRCAPSSTILALGEQGFSCDWSFPPSLLNPVGDGASVGLPETKGPFHACASQV